MDLRTIPELESCLPPLDPDTYEKLRESLKRMVTSMSFLSSYGMERTS